MEDLAHAFTPLERQVIVLAATHERECDGLPGARFSAGWLARALERVGLAVPLRPLANHRLETLRRLACACFASGGRPREEAVNTALDAGLERAQVTILARLAARHFSLSGKPRNDPARRA